MMRSIANVSIVVRDYDEAIAWYTRCLGFALLADVALTAEKRWVRVAPANDTGAALLLARASGPEQLAHVGNQTGGRVFLFLHTDDFWRDYRDMQGHGVHFVEAPREEAYGTVVVFEDLYGNRWDLVEHGPAR